MNLTSISSKSQTLRRSGVHKLGVQLRSSFSYQLIKIWATAGKKYLIG
jgi:hypothetical protein